MFEVKYTTRFKKDYKYYDYPAKVNQEFSESIAVGLREVLARVLAFELLRTIVVLVTK